MSADAQECTELIGLCQSCGAECSVVVTVYGDGPWKLSEYAASTVTHACTTPPTFVVADTRTRPSEGEK